MSDEGFKLVKAGAPTERELNERHAQLMADFKEEWLHNRSLHAQHQLSTVSALVRLLLRKGIIY